MNRGLLWLNNTAPIHLQRGDCELIADIPRLSRGFTLVDDAIVYENHTRPMKVRDTPPNIFRDTAKLMDEWTPESWWSLHSIGDLSGVHDMFCDQIPVVRINMCEPSNVKRRVLVETGDHSREWYSQEAIQVLQGMLIRQSELLRNKNEPQPGCELPNDICIDIVPMVNVFGFLCTLCGPGHPCEFKKAPPHTVMGGRVLEPRLTRKSPHVDINRNYDYAWGDTAGCSHDCRAEDYCGPSPASEPETRAMKGLIQSVPYDLVCSFHSYGNNVLMVGGRDPVNGVPRDDLAYKLSVKLSHLAPHILFPYMPKSERDKQPTFLYPTSGEFGDWVTNIARRSMLTVELGPVSAQFAADHPEGQFDKVSMGSRICKCISTFYTLKDSAA